MKGFARLLVVLLAAVARAQGTATLLAAPPPTWSSDGFEEFVARAGFGQVARNWTAWYQDANPSAPGEREWNIVNGESGFAQEFRKSRVRMGLFRGNSGFTPGATYRFQLRARWLTPSAATSAPLLYLGIHPGGGTHPDEVSWSSGLPVSTQTSWSTLAVDLTVPGETATVFVKVDYSHFNDYGVAIDNLSIQPTGSGNQPPSVSLSIDETAATAPASFVLTALASDPDGTVSKVEFYQGTTLLSTDSTGPYSFNWTGVAAGSYSLTARAFDDTGASAVSNAVSLSVTSAAPPAALDPGVVWISDSMDIHNGELVKNWSKWPAAGGPGMEWFIVPGESGWWAQEVRKTNVDVGISRPNRGFKAGDFYRLRFRARKTSGIAAPKVYAGVKPEGGTLGWGNPVSISSTTSWVDVSYDFIASSWTKTLYLRADLRGLSDTGVAFDNVTVELLSPRDPEPWMISGAPPVEPIHIHGIHDAGAEEVFVQANRDGWVTEALEIQSDPDDHSGRRFPQWIDGIGVLCRIAHRFGQILPDPGTPPQYPGLDDFAQRAANFVKSSVGCGIWSIGNEPHLERAPDPEVYAEAFARTYRAIKAVRPQAKVLTAGFVHGDLDYFNSALQGIERRGVIPDGIALHTYTDSQGWNEQSFRDYQVKIESLPPSMAELPVYITEAGTGGPGNPTTNNGLIDTMFQHVHQWNLSGEQQVRAVCIYRWIAGADKWSIEDNPGMRADFVASLASDYRWFPSSDNQSPAVSLSTDKTAAQAPGTFVLSATASDTDGTVSRIEFYEGARLLSTDTTSPYSFIWSDVPSGTYALAAKAYDDLGASSTSSAVSVTVSAPSPSSNLITNGDFSSGLSGWSVWVERGALNQGVNGESQAHILSGNHNGGLYQSFDTGGPGRRITIDGSWGSQPTQADYQWAEILVINGPDLPAQGQDVVAGRTVGQSPVILIYKNDTFRSKSGWSGAMNQTAAVVDVGAFTSAGGVATLILKSGNMGTGTVSGTVFDQIEVK